MALFDKHMGVPRYTVLHLWAPRLVEHLGRSSIITLEDEPRITVEAQGGWRTESAPAYGSPGSDAVWVPVLEGLQQLVLQRGWDATTLLIGLAGDGVPSRRTVAFFERHAPAVRWQVFSHFHRPPVLQEQAYQMANELQAGWLQHAYVAAPDRQQLLQPLGGWDLPVPESCYPRHFLYTFSTPEQYFLLPDATTIADLGGMRGRGSAGFCGLGLTRWPDPTSQRLEDLGSWSELLRLAPTHLAGRGPEGPVTTVRLEMLRMGLQRREARCVLERALKENRMPEGKRQQAADLLLKLRRDLYRGGAFDATPTKRKDAADIFTWSAGDTWREDLRLLYELAGLAAASTTF